jgi:hypothetical protein
MFHLIAFFQMPTDAPTSFIALNWIMTGALAAALVYVFRQWQAEKRNCVQQDRETIDKLLEALHEQIEDDE